MKTKSTPVSRKRLASESSEISESSNSAPPTRLEEVAGVEPEVQRTPRKIDGVKGIKIFYFSNISLIFMEAFCFPQHSFI